jgi:hypothetical protein
MISITKAVVTMVSHSNFVTLRVMKINGVLPARSVKTSACALLGEPFPNEAVALAKEQQQAGLGPPSPNNLAAAASTLLRAKADVCGGQVLRVMPRRATLYEPQMGLEPAVAHSPSSQPGKHALHEH